jgi:hypothetical protein
MTDYKDIISESTLMKDWGLTKDVLDYLIERKNFPKKILKSGENGARVFSKKAVTNWFNDGSPSFPGPD